VFAVFNNICSNPQTLEEHVQIALHGGYAPLIRLRRMALYNNNNNNNPICKAPECQKTSVALAGRNSRAN